MIVRADGGYYVETARRHTDSGGQFHDLYVNKINGHHMDQHDHLPIVSHHAKRPHSTKSRDMDSDTKPFVHANPPAGKEGHRHSKEPMPYGRALRQMKALYKFGKKHDEMRQALNKVREQPITPIGSI